MYDAERCVLKMLRFAKDDGSSVPVDEHRYGPFSEAMKSLCGTAVCR